MTAFRDPFGDITGDPRHSDDGARYVLLGQSERQLNEMIERAAASGASPKVSA